MKNSVKNIATSMVSNNTKANPVFMAWGQQSKMPEFTPTPKYIGLATCEMVAINPNKAKLEELGFNPQEEPVYTGKNADNVEQAKVVIYLKTIADKCNGIDAIFHVDFWVSSQKWVSTDGSKMQVIDKYGNTNWMTAAEFQSKATTLQGKNGPYKASVIGDIRGAFRGEEELVQFIRIYRSIMSPTALVNGEWVENPRLKEQKLPIEACQCFFEEKEIGAMMGGDFSAVKAAFEKIVDNIQVAVGLKQTEVDGKQKTYQEVYNKAFMYGGSSYTKGLVKALKNDGYTEAGTTYCKHTDSGVGHMYSTEVLHEHTVNSTDFTQNDAQAAAPASAANWG